MKTPALAPALPALAPAAAAPAGAAPTAVPGAAAGPSPAARPAPPAPLAASLRGARPAPTSTALADDGAEAAPAWSRFAAPGAAAGEPVPSDIRGLVAYRRRRREAAASGQHLPRLDLGQLSGDAAAPAPVQALMRAVDAILPRAMQEKELTLARLFQLDQPTPRGVANRWQKTLAGAGALTAGYVAWELGKQVTGVGDVALALGSALAGQKLAGAVSYVMHDLIDEYDAFPESFEFQVHHEDPGELGRWDAANTVANVGRVAVPALGLLAALEPTLGLGTAALSFVGSLYLSPLFHKWTHLPALAKDAPALERFQRRAIDLAQQVGLLVDKHTHLEHHAGRAEGRMEREPKLPHTASFDVSSGDLLGSVNQVMNDLEVSQRLKRAIYLVSKHLGGEGIEPHSWTEHPELRARWGGEGTDVERDAAWVGVRARGAERRISALRRELEAAEALLASGQGPSGQPATADQRRLAEHRVKTLPGALARMEADLARLTGEPGPAR